MKISAKEFRDRATNYLVESQNSFSGGMNLLDSDTDLLDSEYGPAFNLVNRDGRLVPMLGDEEIGSGINGKKQGIYAIGAYLVVFVAGAAYYKVPNSDNFNRIDDFALSPKVERLYVAFIPASTLNLGRYLNDAADTNSIKINPAITVQGSPQGLLVQDGINQPLLIYIDVGGAVKARRTQNYDQWQLSNREYVPIGLDMIFVDGILFIVSADRTRLYRSVTGRPLDFVVNVTANGDKGGDAETTNYAISYSLITALAQLSTTSFMVCTDAPFSYLISINREQTIFAEPTFGRVDLFSTSAVNGFSFVDILGDTALITQRGIRSFNASRQSRIESQNAIFSRKLQNAFTFVDGSKKRRKILQTGECAAINFDDFALFSLYSVYGPIVAIYDTLRQVWASFLLLTNSDGLVKQFASTIPHADELYAITTDDKILKLFNADYLDVSVETKHWAFDDLRVKQKLSVIDLLVQKQTKDHRIVVTAIVDNLPNAEIKTQALLSTVGVNNLHFDFSVKPRTGWKIGYIIVWGGGGELSTLNHISIADLSILDQTQKTLR